MDYLLGGKEKLDKKLERARSGQSSGPSNALATFEITRPMVGASALGIAQAAYEWTLEYLEGKEDEGGPLLDQQRVQQVLADVATEIDAARLLVWRAAWMGRNGMPMTGGQGSMSKLKAGDVTMWATTTLMDLVGEYAQTTECPLEKWFRDAKIYQLFEGTAQVQRLVISRMQRQDYRERREAAAEVLEQAPGTATGDSAIPEKEPAAAVARPRPHARRSQWRAWASRSTLRSSRCCWARRSSTCARCGCWRAAGTRCRGGSRRRGTRAWRSRPIGLLSPLDGLGEELLIAHMGQHLLIADLAAPLLLVGMRSPVYAFLLPRPVLVAAGPPAAACGGCSAGCASRWWPFRCGSLILYGWHLGVRVRGRAGQRPRARPPAPDASCWARCWCGGR